MITALGLTRRETLLFGAAAFASTIARPAVAQEGPERHGMSAFGDLKYPAGFKHFDYVDPNAPKGEAIAGCRKRRVCVQCAGSSGPSAAVATSREGHRSPRSGRA
jgi:hypothetical protein